jgi:hypothetical protein
MKVITSFSILIKYAHELGQARLSQDPERIKKAQEKHDVYRDLCLRADEISLNRTCGDLND